jgi:F0F1-type ATP synthase assembly protein I
MTIDLPAARRVAFGVVRGQAAVTVAAAAAGWALGGPHAALSAALGGAIGTAASLAMALLAFGRGAKRRAPSAYRILGRFYIGELLKIAVAVAAFVLVLELTSASPGAMFATYLATFLVYWIVLARMAFPALAARRAGT